MGEIAMQDEKARFLGGMRRVSGAVAVITTTGPNGERRGVTATAFCSVTADPPSILACINRETWVGQLAPLSGNFAVNVLSGADQPIAEIFAGRTALSGESRFQSDRWQVGQSGAPVLDDALACFDCRLSEATHHATHVILIGRVIDTRTDAATLSPLLYAQGAFTTTAGGDAADVAP